MPYALPMPPGTPRGLPTDTNPGSMAGSIATESLSGDSLTRYIRSLANYLAAAGESGYGYGQGIIGQGAGGLARASEGAQPAMDYWTRLLTGNAGEINAALAPEISRINEGYNQAFTSANMLNPRGGGSTTTNAMLPYLRNRDVSNLYFGVRPQAAQGVTQAAGLQADIAQALSQLGLGQTQAGQNLLNMASNVQLTRRGQNVSEHGQALGLAGQLGGSLIGNWNPVIRGR